MLFPAAKQGSYLFDIQNTFRRANSRDDRLRAALPIQAQRKQSAGRPVPLPVRLTGNLHVRDLHLLVTVELEYAVKHMMALIFNQQIDLRHIGHDAVFKL